MKIMFYLFSKCYFILSPKWLHKVEKRTEKTTKIQTKICMPLVSRQNLDYKRYWLHYYYYFTLKSLFYKKGYVTYVVIFSYILYIILVSTIPMGLSKKKKNSPNAKEKKRRGEIEVCIYESYLRNVFKPPVSAK